MRRKFIGVTKPFFQNFVNKKKIFGETFAKNYFCKNKYQDHGHNYYRGMY